MSFLLLQLKHFHPACVLKLLRNDLFFKTLEELKNNEDSDLFILQVSANQAGILANPFNKRLSRSNNIVK